MLAAIGYIALAVSVLGNIILWYLKNKTGKTAQILKLKNDLYEAKEKDAQLKEKHIQALALNQTDTLDGIYCERERLSKTIAGLRDKLRKEGVDY